MKNMTGKEKFLFIFLQVITLGLIWIYWKKKTKIYRNENELSQELKIGININKLVNLLGGSDNIKNVTSTHTKVKIEYNLRNKIDLEKIKEMSNISGVFLNDSALTIIVGNSATAVCKSLSEYANKGN